MKIDNFDVVRFAGGPKKERLLRNKQRRNKQKAAVSLDLITSK